MTRKTRRPCHDSGTVIERAYQPMSALSSTPDSFEPQGGAALSWELDIWGKFKKMQGFSVWFQPGFDCSGLPIENAVEKKLGIKTAVVSGGYGKNVSLALKVLRLNGYFDAGYRGRIDFASLQDKFC
jgi:hypothetical protein